VIFKTDLMWFHFENELVLKNDTMRRTLMNFWDLSVFAGETHMYMLLHS